MKRLMRYFSQFYRQVVNPFLTINQTPIIILGNQKSGTSAIAHLLADIGGLSKAVDIPPFWLPYGAYIMQGKIQFDHVVQKHRRYFVVDIIKEPNFIFFIDDVMRFFPDAKYIFIIRDPRENIRSILNRRNILGDRDTIPDNMLPDTWKGIIFDPNIWGGAEENYIGVLSHRWNLAVENYLKYEDRITLIRYEDFLASKVGSITQLAQKVGIALVNDISDRVDIQYQPRGNHSISWQEFFGDANLATINRICGEQMAKFGYETDSK